MSVRVDKYETEIYTCSETGITSDDPKEIPQCNVCGVYKRVEDMRWCEYGHYACPDCVVKIEDYNVCVGECHSLAIKEEAELARLDQVEVAA